MYFCFEQMRKEKFINIFLLKEYTPSSNLMMSMFWPREKKKFKNFPNPIIHIGPILSLYVCIFYVLFTCSGKQFTLLGSVAAGGNK